MRYDDDFQQSITLLQTWCNQIELLVCSVDLEILTIQYSPIIEIIVILHCTVLYQSFNYEKPRVWLLAVVNKNCPVRVN